MASQSRRVKFVAFLLLSVLIYELPYGLTLAKTGWTSLPPIFDLDQTLYLVLSTVQHAGPSLIINPWYGMAVPLADVSHLHFPVAFTLFGWVHRLFISWLTAMLVWNALWIALSFAAAVFCLRAFFPNGNLYHRMIIALGLLVLRSPLTYISFGRQVFAHGSLFDLTLPYIRFAFPQVIVPVVLLYWALQVSALKKGSWRCLGGMALLQLLALTSYPYILPVLALGTAITLIVALVGGDDSDAPSHIAPFVAFGCVCAVLDFAYLALSGFGHSHGNVNFAPQFNRALVFPSFRPYMGVLVLAALLALVARVPLAVRATAAGLALANAVLGFSDIFFSFDAQMQVHINYINDLTTLLPLVAFIWPLLEDRNHRVLWNSVLAIITALGLWGAYSSHRTFIGLNLSQAAAQKALANLQFQAGDLVIAPSQFTDDVSAWIPLISPARVLFTIDGENILSAGDIRTEHNLREAAYLRLTGLDASALVVLTSGGKADNKLGDISLHGERGYLRSPLPAHRAEIRRLIRERLTPVLDKLETDPAAWQSLFAGSKRVIIVDSVKHPVFADSAVNRWFESIDIQNEGAIKVQVVRLREHPL